MKNKHVTIDHDVRETRLVRRDLNLVIVLNLGLLGLLLAAYFINRSGGQVDRLFADIVHF